MKKLCFVVTLLASLFVGAGNVHAQYCKLQGGPLPAGDENIKDGLVFAIGHNIPRSAQEGELSWNEQYSWVLQDLDLNNYNVCNNVKANSAVGENAMWVLEQGDTDAEGTWYYIKNKRTGEYLGFEAPTNVDLDDPSSLPGFKYNIWYNDSGAAMCTFYLKTVAEKAAARQFLITSVENGRQMLEGGEAGENLQQLIDASTNCTMLVARIVLDDNTPYYVAVNMDLEICMVARWSDFAAYVSLIPAVQEDNVVKELMLFMQNLAVTEFEHGTGPGYVVWNEAVENYNARVAYINGELANAGNISDEIEIEGSGHTLEEWNTLLAEAKALEAAARSFEFQPVTPGYYRIVSACGDFEAKQGVKKALYGYGNRVRWTTFDSNASDQLWEISEQDGEFYLRNVGLNKYAYHDGDFWLHDNLVESLGFERIGQARSFHIVGDTPEAVMHAQYHSNGEGNNGNVCTFYGNTADDFSAWYLEPVAADVADIVEFNVLLNRAQASVQEARDYFHPVCDIQNPEIDEDNKIFTVEDNDGTHVTSPCSDQTEGNIDNLLDGIIGDAGNFWHSDWHGTYTGTWCNGYHYLQFDLKQGYQKLALYYVPRVRPAGNNNTFEGWPEEFTIYYSNTPDDEESWKRGVSFGEGDIVADLHDLCQNYLPFYINEGAQYVRVVCTKGYAWRNGHKFWMAGEMNFCTYEADVIYDEGIDLLAKADLQGEGVATALLAAIEAADVENLEALRAAYDAFMAVYTSPANLKSMVVEAKGLLNSVEYGEEAGKKPTSAKEALAAALATAEAWLVDGIRTCTKAEHVAEEEALRAAINAWKAVDLNPDVATFVEGIATAAGNGNMFDLSGRRVNKAGKGLYIIGGKKVVM